MPKKTKSVSEIRHTTYHAADRIIVRHNTNLLTALMTRRCRQLGVQYMHTIQNSTGYLVSHEARSTVTKGITATHERLPCSRVGAGGTQATHHGSSRSMAPSAFQRRSPVSRTHTTTHRPPPGHAPCLTSRTTHR